MCTFANFFTPSRPPNTCSEAVISNADSNFVGLVVDGGRNTYSRPKFKHHELQTEVTGRSRTERHNFRELDCQGTSRPSVTAIVRVLPMQRLWRKPHAWAGNLVKREIEAILRVAGYSAMCREHNSVEFSLIQRRIR